MRLFMLTCLDDWSTIQFYIAYGNTIIAKVEVLDDPSAERGYTAYQHRVRI